MFHSDRALAITAFFLGKNGGRMNAIGLAKLQYLVERTAIVTYRSPIVDDNGARLPHGPVLSETLRMMTKEKNDPLWNRHVHYEPKSGGGKENVVVLDEPFDAEEVLSPVDMEILEAIWHDFGGMTPFQLRDWCHANLPEWEGGTKRGHWIQLEDIFVAVGNSPEMAAQKAREIRYHQRLDARLEEIRAAV